MNTQAVYVCMLFVALLISASGCHKQYLTGYYSMEEFRDTCEWNTIVKENYKPRDRWMDSLATIKDSVRMQVFLGTYCPDSKRWVPKMFSLLPQIPVSDTEIISVDTTKTDKLGISTEAGLNKIPTFVFYDQNDREIGRIVEKPRMRLEKRIFRELKKGE